MKTMKLIIIVIFWGIIVAPLVAFNFQEDAVSLIDNRKLAGNPFQEKGDFTSNVETYVNDRIGFRDDMISAFTLLNDKVFHKMIHPSYIYGTEGYVFGNGAIKNKSYTEYHEIYADMVKQIQDYCDDRNVPFLFVFNPAKTAILTEYLPKEVNYDRTWVDQFFSALDQRHVRYIDNTLILQDKYQKGEAVFNQKYDANHWNDLGAYYGTYAMLQELRKDLPMIHLTEKNELRISEKEMTSLPVSEFPIHEMVPAISMDMHLDSARTAFYDDELKRNASFSHFGYEINDDRKADGAPKALVFQGSYMIGYGRKYLSNAFGEYIHVHDYQNVINFPYYFNIFQPDCVIFEVAESTLNDNYFDSKAMKAMKLNPTIQSIEAKNAKKQDVTLNINTVSVDKGTALTTITWINPQATEYVWLVQDTVYDMQKTEAGYVVGITTEAYEKANGMFEIITWDGRDLIQYNHE